MTLHVLSAQTGPHIFTKTKRGADAVAGEYASWDRATERRADPEYALDPFKDRQDLSAEEQAQFEERCQRMQFAINVARQEEKEAERLWRHALARAKREIARRRERFHDHCQSDHHNPHDRVWCHRAGIARPGGTGISGADLGRAFAGPAGGDGRGGAGGPASTLTGIALRADCRPRQGPSGKRAPKKLREALPKSVGATRKAIDEAIKETKSLM